MGLALGFGLASGAAVATGAGSGAATGTGSGIGAGTDFTKQIQHTNKKNTKQIGCFIVKFSE